MINFKYLTSVLKSELQNCTGNIVKSLFLTDDDISYLNSKECIVSIICNEFIAGKYLVEFDRSHLIALCN